MRKKSHLTKVIRERPVLTQERALELFEYDKQTGALYWKVAKAKRIHPGQEAGAVSEDGHVAVRVDNWTYQASHIAVLMVTGRLPRGRVGHLDGDNSNNAWENLSYE
jgi:hypothetical protein